MGGHPYWYVVPYEQPIDLALQKLRMREFKAGRYNPVIEFPDFPITASSPAPGTPHSSYDEAFEDADADGTRSIIDLMRAADKPSDGREPPYGVAYPVAESTLTDWFGTRRPTEDMLADCEEMWESLERGSGIYILLYKGEKPDRIFFAGYSFD